MAILSVVEDLSKQAYLENYLEGYLKKVSMQFIKKTQEEFKGDPFRWNLAARRKFFTVEEYQKYDWTKHYPEAVVNLSYDIKLKGFGKQLNPPEKPKQNKDLEDNIM
jgi:spore germination protein KC